MKKRSKKWLFEKNNQLRKLFKIMRLSVILLFIGMHLTFANVGAQSKVTIEHQFVTYQELFSQIQKQTGLTVVYSNNELNKDKKIQAGSGLLYFLLYQREYIVSRLNWQQRLQCIQLFSKEINFLSRRL